MATILDLHQRETQREAPFPDVRHSPAEHFRLACYAAVSVIWEQVAHACGSVDVALEEFPFLGRYAEQIQAAAGSESSLSAWWLRAVREWEAQVGSVLPIQALREVAALDEEALAFLFAVGLVEEDPSFGVLFEVAQARPALRRPTASLMHAWWRNAFPERDARAIGRQLLDLGLVRLVDSGTDDLYEVPPVVWDALRGVVGVRPFPGATHIRHDRLPDLADVVLEDGLQARVGRLCTLLATGEIETLVVRGPRRNGRQMLMQAIARKLGRSALCIDQAIAGNDLDHYAPGPLAIMLKAMPILRFDLGAGEVGHVPALPGYSGPVGIVAGPRGGLDGERLARAFTLDLPVPDFPTRIRHWQLLGKLVPGVEPADAARRLRLTSGNLHRVAALAPGHARIDGRTSVSHDDLRHAGSALNRQALDTLATWLPPLTDASQLIVPGVTQEELTHLVRRCRHRDELHASLGPAFSAQQGHGVRALFAGPSGTGKTFAARLLAGELGSDLYRIDLAAVVDKYIGETEKHLDRLFAHAEDLDVILLLDEGDALLGERSAVHSATDRYANLETNFLLQRLETFDGILIVTTNASDRIDRAFERRMDVVVSFQLPEARERAAIWRSHLPARRSLSELMIDAAADAYRLSGGHIRNAALHAGLLALDDGGAVTVAHLEAAIRREYRKLGKIAPSLDPHDLPVGEGDG